MMLSKHARFLSVAVILTAASVLLACGGDDDHAMHDMDGMEHMADPGVVSPKSADANQVDVTIREWGVAAKQSSVAAGKVYFLVENAGPEHPHELVIIRSDVGLLELPITDNKVPEDQVDLVDEIEEFAPQSSALLTVELTPGRYLLVCNISEADPEIGSHYRKGMVAALTVQ